MKKLLIALAVFMILVLAIGGAYYLSDGFKVMPWDKFNPAPESNILTESKDLLNNHVSIKFGTGDSAWTISTADNVEPIYIDDLRSSGKGFNIGHSSSGGISVGIPLESDISISGSNISNILISAIMNNRYADYSISRKDGGYIWDWCASSIYENILCSFSADGIPSASEIERIETAIINEGYKSGDNYFIGLYQIVFQFQDFDKYGEESLLKCNSLGVGSALFINFSVYYRVK